MKYPVHKGGEAAYNKANALQHFCFVVAAFCETIEIWNIKDLPSFVKSKNQKF